MLSSVRTYDFVGRYGGEEFLVVVPGSELGSAAELAERLRQAVSAQPVTFADVLIPVTLSLGVVASIVEPGQPGQLLRQADEALYVAKKTGRNKVESALSAQPTAPHAG